MTRVAVTSKPVVVMLHGFMGSGRDLDPLARKLAQHVDCHVVLPDLPGHGSSGHVAPESLAQAAAYVWDTLAVGPGLVSFPVLLAGYSLGGRVALAMAEASPDRVRGLFLESAHPGLTTEMERQARWRHDVDTALRLENAVTETDLQAFLTEWYQQPVFLRDGRPPADMEGRITARMEGFGARSASLQDAPLPSIWLAAALRAYSLATQPDFWPVCGRFGRRAWYISGAADRRYCDVGQKLARRHPDLHHRIVPGAGHTVHIDTPDAYLETLQTFVTTCIS